MATIRGGRLNGGEVGDLHIRDGLLVAEPTDDDIIDADGLIVSPGLIDIQINGGFGHDFTQDPTTIWQVGERLPEVGVTAFVPTIVTSPPEITDLALEVVAKRRPATYRGAEVLGLHFEGPWISPEMHGAHNVTHIVDPDVDVARSWADSSLVRIVTLAPERPGASEVAEILRDGGVAVSVGHTAADFATARRAFSDYATLATHLFNQMSGLRHRDPGTVGASLLDADACLLIVDGLHIADGTLEITWRLLGSERTILVTDAMAALGLGAGTYPLGDGPITVGDAGPRTVEGKLAGSVITLPQALRNLATVIGVDVASTLVCGSANPARVLRLPDRGALQPGMRADVTVFDDDMGVVATMVGGDIATGR